MFHQISDWRSVPENRELLEKLQHEKLSEENIFYAPSPLEVQLGKKYGIEWREAIDWIGNNPEEHINWFANAVFVATKWETWTYMHTTYDLMRHFGSQSLYRIREGDSPVEVAIQINWQMPDEDSASEIYSQISNYLKHKRQIEPPWAIHRFEGVIGDNHDTIKQSKAKLTFLCIFFHLGASLPNLLRWLEKQGATNITYKIPDEVKVQ